MAHNVPPAVCQRYKSPALLPDVENTRLEKFKRPSDATVLSLCVWKTLVFLNRMFSTSGR
jgi:hypothetical protein